MIDGFPWGVVGALSPSAGLMIVFFMVMLGKLGTPGHMKVLNDQIKDKNTTIRDLTATVNEQRDMLFTAIKSTQTIEHVGSVVEHTMSTISDQKAGD